MSAPKEKKEKKKGAVRASDDGSKKKKERGARDSQAPAPSPEALQTAVTTPIVLIPLPLDAYSALVDAGARALLTTSASDALPYSELSRTLITLETSITSLLGRITREFAEPLRQRANFPGSANTLLFGQLENLTKISGRLIGVYESSGGISGTIDRIRRKLSETETVYCQHAYSYAHISSVIFNLEQEKAFAEVLKTGGSKAGLGTLFGAVLHYPAHYFALWRRLKADEIKATPEAARLIVDLERFVKSVRVHYDNGCSAVKLQELNARLTNPEQASLLAGGDMRQLQLLFKATILGAKKEVALLNDVIMYFRPNATTETKLDYESLQPLAEVQKLEVSPGTAALRIFLVNGKNTELTGLSADASAIAKLLQKCNPRIIDSQTVIPVIAEPVVPRKDSKDPLDNKEGGSRTEAKDAKKEPKRAVTPSKRDGKEVVAPAAAPKDPTGKLKAESREGGRSPLRGASPLRKRPDGEDEVMLHEEEMSSESDILNTEDDGPQPIAEKETSKSGEPKKEEKQEGGWGDMIVSFFKGEQNVAQVKKRTDPSHKLPVLITSIEDFPREIKSLLKNTGIPMEKFDKNLTILTNVLYFTTHRNFFTKETREKRKAEKKAGLPVAPLQPSELPPDAPARHFAEEAAAELAKEENARRLYKLAQQAGKGGFGKVYDARFAAPNGKRVAIKRMPNVVEKDRTRNQTEIGALKLCKHPNIVEYHAAHKVQDEIWLVMEFMEGGTLTEAAKAHNFTEKEIAFVSREILKAIQFLHARFLVHRDLKSSNVMMSTSGEIKLIDFGLCCDIRTCRRGKMAGSPYWMPPEMICRQQYGVAIDIWSFAVCIIELAMRNPPNKSNPIKAMFLTATDGIKDSGLDRVVNWSKEFREFLALCLPLDPEKRATATQLLTHDFLKKAEEHKNMEKVLSSIFLHNTLAVLGTGFG